MKLKSILVSILCFVCLNCSTVVAQLSVEFTQTNFVSFSKNNMWNFFIVNSNPATINGRLVIDLTDNTSGAVLTITSPGFPISTGMNADFSMLQLQSQSIYGSSALATSFLSSDNLPLGSFTLCVHIYATNEDEELAQNCFSFNLGSLYPFYLISPADQETILTVQPLLTWLPLGSNPPNLSYHVKLTQLGEGQTKEEAMADNILLLNSFNVPSNSLPYPSSSPPLEHGKEYAWQVEAMSNQSVVAITDVWQFKIATIPVDSSQLYDCYRGISTEINSNIYLFKDYIKVSYDNRTNSKTLKYKITNLKNGQSVNCSPTIALKYGVNKIDIDVEKCSFVENTPYILKVLDEYSRIYQLSFMIKN